MLVYEFNDKKPNSRQAEVAINRLLRLAEFLRELDRVDFNMSNYAQSISGDSRDTDRLKGDAIHCSTVCCIAGWATKFHPDLRLRGNEVRIGHGRKLSIGFEAFEEAFYLPWETTYDLCATSAPHQTPKLAARAVEKVAEEMADTFGYDIVSY